LEQTIRGTESGLSPNGVDSFHTPNTTGLDGGSNSRKALKKRQENWPTPEAHERNAYPRWNKTRNGKQVMEPNLAGAVMTWPTPRASDFKGATSAEAMNKAAARGFSPNLPEATASSVGGGSLNPTWVEKLMGWPDEWTSIKPINHVTMCFWLMGMHNGTEIGRNEVLRMLRDGNAAQEIQREIGRPVSIYEAAILLAELCEYKNRPNEARVFMACAEALEEEVRSLRLHQGASSSPHRSEQDAQRTGEHSDVMQALSRLLAHHGKAAWQDGGWEDTIPRVADGVAARVDRLKAIGNGQVPLCAATAWRILSK
jgi:hypothetical protein